MFQKLPWKVPWDLMYQVGGYIRENLHLKKIYTDTYTHQQCNKKNILTIFFIRMLYEASYCPGPFHTIEYINIDGDVETLKIDIDGQPVIVITEIYSNITLKKIKGAFPKMNDDDVWEELVNISEGHAEAEREEPDRCKRSQRWRARDTTIQFIAFLILYRKYGTMFTPAFFGDEDDE